VFYFSLLIAFSSLFLFLQQEKIKELTKQLNEQWNKTVLLEKELVAHAEVGID
jgi:hypothetical protein